MATNAIKTISFSRLKNAHHVGFHSKVLSEIDKQESSVLGIDNELYTRYKTAVATMQDIVNRSRASDYTVLMNNLDSQRDNLYRKCIYLLKAVVCGGPTQAIQEDTMAALKTKIVDLYPVSIADGGNQEETAKIRGFIKDLEGDFEGVLEDLGIQSALTELKAVNNQYEEAFMDRIRNQTTLTNTVDARTACDDAFMQISFYLNSTANIVATSGELKAKAAVCNRMVDVINTLISYYQSHYYSKVGTAEDTEDSSDGTNTAPDSSSDHGNASSQNGVDGTASTPEN